MGGVEKEEEKPLDAAVELSHRLLAPVVTCFVQKLSLRRRARLYRSLSLSLAERAARGPRRGRKRLKEATEGGAEARLISLEEEEEKTPSTLCCAGGGEASIGRRGPLSRPTLSSSAASHAPLLLQAMHGPVIRSTVQKPELATDEKMDREDGEENECSTRFASAAERMILAVARALPPSLARSPRSQRPLSPPKQRQGQESTHRSRCSQGESPEKLRRELSKMNDKNEKRARKQKRTGLEQ